MEFVFEKIPVPRKNSFITRRLKMDHNSDKIHSHRNFELNLIISGSGRRIIGNHISSYTKGDLVLLGPDIFHCWEVLETENEASPECIVTHFYEDILGSNFFNVPELESVVSLLHEAGAGILFKGRKAAKAKVTDALMRMVTLEGLERYVELLKVFNMLLHIEEREYLALPSSLPVSRKKDYDQINRIYEYVFKNIREGVKLEEAARLIFMEPGSFCRYFKKKTKQTFKGYVKSVRIGIAAKLLAETDKPVTLICYECGYNNLANFNHYFRKTMNKTPTEYRKEFA